MKIRYNIWFFFRSIWYMLTPQYDWDYIDQNGKHYFKLSFLDKFKLLYPYLYELNKPIGLRLMSKASLEYEFFKLKEQLGSEKRHGS